MAIILHLETSTKTCSVAISKDAQLVGLKEITEEQYSHAENLNPFIEDVMKEEGIDLKQLDAVSVSAGPGSYTGLRIGCSSAKGLCYGLDIPMIAVDSLQALAALRKDFDGLICPMFDARRMEVFAEVYDNQLNVIRPLEAVILEEYQFGEELSDNKVLFLGPGAEKSQQAITSENAEFDLTTAVSARGMIEIAHKKYDAKDFVDTAYFEPNYLKNFVALKPKSQL